jgi:stress response protein YsnF
MLEQVRPGDRVIATDGEVGRVVEVLEPGEGGSLAAILIRSFSGELVEIPVADIEQAGEGTVRIALSSGAVTGQVTAPLDTGGEEIHRLLAHEEFLEPRTVPADRGTVRVVRHVERVPVAETIETERDDVLVERVPVGREVDERPDIRMDGETLVVPVVDEVIFSETRLVLREEVRITRRTVSEPVTVEGDLIRERIEVVQSPPSGSDHQPGPPSQ